MISSRSRRSISVVQKIKHSVTQARRLRRIEQMCNEQVTTAMRRIAQGKI